MSDRAIPQGMECCNAPDFKCVNGNARCGGGASRECPDCEIVCCGEFVKSEYCQAVDIGDMLEDMTDQQKREFIRLVLTAAWPLLRGEWQPIDEEAIGWALSKLDAFGVGYRRREDALMIDRLKRIGSARPTRTGKAAMTPGEHLAKSLSKFVTAARGVWTPSEDGPMTPEERARELASWVCFHRYQFSMADVEQKAAQAIREAEAAMQERCAQRVESDGGFGGAVRRHFALRIRSLPTSGGEG